MDIKQRLDTVIQKDKKNNPKHLINLIKSDFYYLINNYFEVDFSQINIDINLCDDKYTISLNCSGDRIKIVYGLPE